MKQILLTHAVKAIIHNDKGEVLLLQRNPAISNQDNWDLPGGLVEPSESFKNALVREVKEELGLVVVVTNQAGKWEFLRLKDQQIVTVQNYHCQIVSGDITLSEEHISYRWVSPSAIREYPVKDGSFYEALD